MRGWLALALLVPLAGCATVESVECRTDYDCPAGERCQAATGTCVPISDAWGEGDVFPDDAGACVPSTCNAECLAAGYTGGTCLGTTCQCAGTPDGGFEDAGGETPDTSLCDPVECDANCAPFGMTGECRSEGCVCLGAADADADAPFDDATAEDVPVDDARVDEGTSCPPGQTLCPGGCVDTSSDALNCGACGRACRTDQACSGGACVCPTGLTECSGRCVDTRTDPANCGRCGGVCGAGRTCSGGTCVCAGGLTDCSGTCVDTMSDANNCGWCGNRCACGPCSGGTCVSSGGTATFYFPDWSDSAYIVGDPYMWNYGDYYQGTRSTSLACATSVTFTLYNDENWLDGDVLALRVSINGTVVGDFSYPAYVYSTTQSFSFPAILGPTYTIRLEVTRTVAYLCGSVVMSLGWSDWTLR
ncbi:MAG: hypothetical protein JXB32_00605 [Deltaproteobacteria bacterium]|nr:hypothetical protein [Deltaproteobacteria bacterium]